MKYFLLLLAALTSVAAADLNTKMVVGRAADCEINLFPNLPDPLQIANVTIDNGLGFYQFTHIIFDGLASLSHCITELVSLDPLIVKSEIKIGHLLHAFGNYAINGYIYLPDPGIVATTLGEGRVNSSLGEVSIGLQFEITVDEVADRASIHNVDFIINYIESLYLVMETLTVSGVPVDWDLFNANVLTWLVSFAEGNKPTLTQILESFVNEILKDVPWSCILGGC